MLLVYNVMFMIVSTLHKGEDPLRINYIIFEVSLSSYEDDGHLDVRIKSPFIFFICPLGSDIVPIARKIGW